MKRKHVVKGLLSVALTLAMVLGEIPVTALATESGGSEAEPRIVTDAPEDQVEEANETGGIPSDTDDVSSPAFDQSAVVDGVRITVTASAGVFPEGAALYASRPVGSDEAAAEKAVEDVRSAGKTVAASYTFDIKVLDKDGNEIQPADSASVKVSFTLDDVADSNLSTDIYHIREKEISNIFMPKSAEAQALSVSESGSTATAETDGFSLYTVEFIYTDKQYVLPGDSEVALADIMEAVGLSGEVSAVSVSDGTLFSVAKNEDGQWIVTAHKAFSTEEWMKVTISDVEYQITVTDDQLPAAKIGETTYGTIPEAITAAQSGNTIILLRDENISAPLEFPSGKALTLDLNGHTIDRGLTNASAKNDGNVIIVNGTLTLKDSGTDGTIEGGNATDEGGGVYVKGGGNFTMQGGSITGCSAILGGGVHVKSEGNFTMQGGTITHCSAEQGGGVCVGRGNFIMQGGSITGCILASSSGKGGGVCIMDEGTFYVSDAPVINSNNQSSNNNVFLNTEKIEIIGALSHSAQIYVNAGSGTTVATAGNDYILQASDAAAFHSDSDENLAGVLDQSGENVVIGSAWSSLQGMLNTGGTVTLNRDYTAAESDTALQIPSGKTVTLDLNGHTIDRGFSINDEGVENGNVITVNGNLTLKDSGSNGTITGGNLFNGNDSNGGGVIVNGTFTMEGGKITGCVSAQSGGGVYVAGNGTFTMKGGAITDCFAVSDGGGVYSEGTFNVSGAPVIKDNDTQYNERKGVDLANDKKIGIIGALRNGAEIWVITNENDTFAAGLGYDITEADAAYFHSDAGNNYVAVLNNEGIKFAQVYTINIDEPIGNGSVTASPTTAVEGATVTLTVTPGEGNVLDTLTVTDSGDNSVSISGTGNTRTFTMPADNVTVDALFVDAVAQVGDVKYTTVQRAINAAPANGTVTLLSDVNINTSLTIASGKTVTLDLNDHTIDRGLAGGTAASNGYVIKVQGDLTLTDGSTAKNGKITGGNDANGLGGGVYVDGGTFTMQGGTIIGNQSSTGGGVYVAGAGIFNMSGGSIIGNNASGHGGGATISEGCTFTVSGCPDISGNWTEGTWDGDAKKYVIDSNNYRSVEDDVQLGSISTYITVTGALTSGANIYVTVSNPRVVAQKASPRTTGLSETEFGYFHSDVSDYTPVLSSDGKVVFKAQAEIVASPQGRDDSFIYDGLGHGVFFPADANGGTVKYAVSHNCSAAPATSDYSEDIPGVKDVGDYYLWYYVEGNDYYIGTTPEYYEFPVTIQPRPITVTGIIAEEKTYDGTTEATLDTSGATLSGKCDGDDLTVSATGTFDNKNAGDDKTVTISNLTLDGEDADNYVLATTGNQTTTTASISPKQITITGITASDKEYDGKTTATLDTTNATISGLVSGDSVEYTVTGTFENATKGNNKTVTLSGWTLSGTDAVNYVVDETGSQQSTTASITGTQVYITGLSAENKVYDGTTAAGITGTAVLKKVNGNAEVSGLTFSDITASFADKNIGEGKTVSITGVTLDDIDNYAINLERTNQELNLTANITAKPVTITGLSAADKTYDTTTTATVMGTAVISGKITGDSLSVSLGSAAFADENVGSGKSVTFTGYSLTGDDAGNYSLSAQPASVTANITKATPTVTAPAAKTDLVYSGSGQALVTAGRVPSGCEMEYALTESTVTTAPDSGWSTSTPEGTDAGSYKVWYKVSGGDNYNDVSAASVAVSIAKADQVAPSLTGPFVITSGNTTAVITGADVTMEYSTDSTNWIACSESLSLGKGTYYIRKKADANHNVGSVATIIVSREGEHTLTVTGGTGSGSFVQGEAVTIVATVPEGERFTRWTANGITLTDGEVAAANLSITMPDGNVTLEAGFEDLTLEFISLNKTSASLTVGGQENLSVTYSPAAVKNTYKVVTWTSSNESVATVDNDGKVTARSAGQAIITATAANGTPEDTGDDKTATCNVTVSAAASSGGGNVSGGGAGGAGGGGAAGGSGSTDKPADTDKPSETDKPADTDKPSDTDKPADTTRPASDVDVAKDPSEGKTPAGKEETSTVTAADGSTTETSKVTNTDGSTTEKEKVTSTDGMISDKTTVTEKDGTVKTQETIESKDGSKVETASEVKPNGDFETKTVTTDKDGKTKEVVETKSTDEAGIVTETKDTIKANGTSTEQTVVTQPGGDYKSETVQKDASGEVTKTVTETKSTNEKTGNVTLQTETVKASGASESSKVVSDSKGNLTKASVTETSSSGKTTTVDLKTDKNGNVVVKNIDSTKPTVTIPEKVVDADGNTHEVNAITAKALSGESKVKTLVVKKNVEVFEKDALKNSGVKTLKLDKVPKFEKNSLKTGTKLTITVHTKAQAKAVEKQLKKAGAPNAKVKIAK